SYVHSSTSFPYTTLFRSRFLLASTIMPRPTCFLEPCAAGSPSTQKVINCYHVRRLTGLVVSERHAPCPLLPVVQHPHLVRCGARSEEHTSELQSRFDLVC